jgi:hypothetical protein
MSATNGSVGLGGAVPGLTGLTAGPVPGFAAWSFQLQCAAMLQRLYGWLQVAVPQQPQLAAVIPLLVQAVQLYRVGQYELCAAQLQPVIGMLNQARAVQPALPPL